MSFQQIIRRLASGWMEHDNVKAAAAIAFFALFTLAPTLVFAVTAAGWFVGMTHAQEAAFDRLAEVIGTQGANLARSILQSESFVQHGLVATVVSAAMLLYGASEMYVQLRSALDTIFGADGGEGRRKLAITLQSRLLGTAFVLLVGLLLVSVLVVNVFLSAASERFRVQLGLGAATWPVIAQLWSVAIVTFIFAMMLRYLPARRPRWRHVWPGVLVGVVLFEIGKSLMAVYLTHSFIASAYGPSSSVVAVVVWIYYTAQIFLLGGEVCEVAIERESAKSAPA